MCWGNANIFLCNSLTCDCDVVIEHKVFLQGFEISSTLGKGGWSTSCPAGKKVLGCHIQTTFQGPEPWRRYFPDDQGDTCQCYDSYGAR
jgi:hypothetical protein